MDSGSAVVTVSFSFTGTENAQGVASSGLSGTTVIQRPKTFRVSIPYGTASGKADIFICQVRTLAGGASEELNLFTGALLDIHKEAAACRTLRRIIIWQIANLAGTTASSGMTIGAAATDPSQLWFGNVNDTVDVNGINGAPFHQGDDAGKVIGSGTARVKVLNKDAVNTLTYLLFIAAASA